MTEWQLTCDMSRYVTMLYHTQAHLLQQGPGLEEAEARVAGVEVEAQRGVQALPAGAVPQGGGQLARGAGHCNQGKHVTGTARGKYASGTHVA